ncbi:hypothetical protein PTI98_004004 [Pleurotus ostreatus]|nr:hypothetical protein PTI98_004004 [Pleurotus ostreatus]
MRRRIQLFHGDVPPYNLGCISRGLPDWNCFKTPLDVHDILHYQSISLQCNQSLYPHPPSAMTMLVFLAGSPDMALDLWSPPQPPKGKAMLDNVVLDPSFHLRLLLRLLNGEFLDLFRYTLEHLHYLSSDVDVDAPGIPGWKSWYGVGPVIPSKAAGDDSDVDAPGIPGWNPHAGVGPVIPSAAPSKVVKRDSDVDVPGIPGWKPIYGVGPAIPSQTSER